jgi:hypothetical protein
MQLILRDSAYKPMICCFKFAYAMRRENTYNQTNVKINYERYKTYNL